MRRIVIAAVAAAAMELAAAAPGVAQSYPVTQYAAPRGSGMEQAAPRQYLIVRQHARAEPDLGGGFIEYLFGERSTARVLHAPQPGYLPPPAAPAASGYASLAPEEAAAPPPQRRRPSIDPRYLPQEVDYQTDEPSGTIIVDTPNRYLYLVEAGGKAMRYGIGVGRPGFTWAGTHTVTAKKEWPDWRPPEEMLKRQPYLPPFMAGGPQNPLGARALYLGSTLYRIHGSNEPWTIGQMVSSGCIRMRNEDVVDLYERVKVGTKVVVL